MSGEGESLGGPVATALPALRQSEVPLGMWWWPLLMLRRCRRNFECVLPRGHDRECWWPQETVRTATPLMPAGTNGEGP